jgi:hypothetical protein
VNTWFFGVLSILAGGLIGGVISVSTPQGAKTITSGLAGACGGVAAGWGGYALGVWEEKRKRYTIPEQSLAKEEVIDSSGELPFTILYPLRYVSFKDHVSGTFKDISMDSQDGHVWLCILDEEGIYSPHRIVDVDRFKSQWKVDGISFGLPSAKDNGNNYELEVILADHDANNQLSAAKNYGLQRLPSGIEHLSKKLVVKRKDIADTSSRSSADKPSASIIVEPQKSPQKDVDNNEKSSWVLGKITGWNSAASNGYITSDDGTSYYFNPGLMFRKFEIATERQVIFTPAPPTNFGKNARATRIFILDSEILLQAPQDIEPGGWCFIKLRGENDYLGEEKSLFVLNAQQVQGGRRIAQGNEVKCFISTNASSKEKGPICKISIVTE